jgi:uncharacterized repeat protein (TIGR03809 family)
MTHRADVVRGRDVVARWCDLAERRLDYLTELFETGRWRRYHSEVAFLENIQEAKAAVETWRDLSTREASRDNSALDMSWLGRISAAPVRAEPLRDQLHQTRSQPVQVPHQSLELALSAEAAHVPSDEAPSAPAMEPPTLDAIAQRYPLLRNAL